MNVVQRFPEIGQTVGEYTLVKLLGRGGFGVVFQAERGGRAFAIKFLLDPRLDARAKREISVLSRLEHPCVVRYVGSDFWPNPAVGLPYIVMDFVPGETLEAFVLKHNPSARKVTRLVLDAARTLGELHEEGVFHRDLKPANIIIRGAAERPVLIDFGIASLAGSPRLTGARIPPATEEFRAPEPLRFWRDHPNGPERYEFGVGDELWALGVTYYWLLADIMPFGEASEEDGGSALHERILHQRPAAPCLVNPRVPQAASRLCMKMLAESATDRYPSVPHLCSALKEVLTQAEDDASWDVPLVDPFESHVTTTAEELKLQEPDDSLRALRRHDKQRPRRGWVRPDEAPAPMEAPPPVAEPEQDRIPAVEAPHVAPRPVEHEPPAPVGEVQAAPDGLEQAVPQVNWAHRVAGRLGLVTALLAAAVGVLYLSSEHWGPGTASRTGKGEPELTRPSTAPGSGSTHEDVRGREMASAPKPLESLPGEGAAPAGAPPPAPTANAMLRTPAQTKKNENQTQRAGLHLPVKPLAAAAVAACMGPGCAGSTTPVRPEPPAVNCPQGWRETHKRFHLTIGEGRNRAWIKGSKGDLHELARVKDGPATLELGRTASIEGFPDGTLLLGVWKLGDGRLFGSFTEAKIPNQGTLPVCLVARLRGGMAFVDEHRKVFECPPGLGVCLNPESTPGNAKTWTDIYLDVPVGQP